MKQPLFSLLFDEWNKNPALEKLGTGDYLLLLTLMSDGRYPVRDFDELVFVIQTLWLKRQSQLEAFRLFFQNRRERIMAMIGVFESSAKGQTEKPVDPLAVQDKVPMNNGTIDPAHNAELKQPGQVNAAPGQSNTSRVAAENFEQEPENAMVSVALGSGGHLKGIGGKGYSIPQNSTLLPPEKKFLMGTEYFPVQDRVLQQSWRTLYSNREVSSTNRFDLQKTILKICREGLFTTFEPEAGRENIFALFVFIDQGGSMIAYEEFGKQMVRSAKASNVHSKKLKPYFFYNVPQANSQNPEQGYLFYNEQKTRAYTSFSLFKGISRKNIVVMIYSDAGAITGNISKERVDATCQFLKNMTAESAYAVWLNPAPEHRWKGTSAEQIASAMTAIPMVEATRNGVARAMEVLKGKLSLKTGHYFKS